MQLALNESNDIDNFNIKKKMDKWKELKYYPVIRVTQEQINVSNINISIFLENVNAIDKMVGIPLTFTLFQRYSHSNNTLHSNKTLWLLPQFGIDSIILPPLDNETFTIVNKLQAGEYKQLILLCI